MKAERGLFQIYIFQHIYRRFWAFEVGLNSVNGANKFRELDFF